MLKLMRSMNTGKTFLQGKADLKKALTIYSEEYDYDIFVYDDDAVLVYDKQLNDSAIKELLPFVESVYECYKHRAHQCGDQEPKICKVLASYITPVNHEQSN